MIADYTCKTTWDDIPLLFAEKKMIQLYLAAKPHELKLLSKRDCSAIRSLCKPAMCVAKTILMEAEKDDAPLKFAEVIAHERKVPLISFKVIS